MIAAKEKKATKKDEPEQAAQAPGLDELREKWVEQIIEAQSQADELDSKRASAESAAKAAKKAHEAAVDRLQELIRRGPSEQLELDFSGMTPEQVTQAKWDAMLSEATVADSLNLAPKQFERLAEANIVTMKDLEDLRAGKNKDYPRGLSDIKGFGESAIDRIEDEIEIWLENNQPEEDGEPDESTLADEVADEFEKAGLLK